MLRGLVSTAIACALSAVALRTCRPIMVTVLFKLDDYVPGTVASTAVFVAPFVVTGLVVNHVLAAWFPVKPPESGPQ